MKKSAAHIVSYTVQKKRVSVQLLVDQPADEELLQMLRTEKGRDGRISLSDLHLVGQIYSYRVVSGNKVHVLLHALRTRFVVKRLYELMRGEVDFTVNTAMEGKLAYFLMTAAKRTGKAESDLLYEITTFTKHGKTIKGKYRVEELSPQAQEVALDKIRQFLKDAPNSAPKAAGTGGE